MKSAYDLRWNLAGGDRPEGVSFYGGPFSNFAHSPIEIDGKHYATVEHWFQSEKAVDPVQRETIRQAGTAAESKRRGRRCTLRLDWEDVKYEVMLRGLRAKFRIPRFQQALLDTGDAFIYEDSHSDFVWGLRDAEGGWTGHNLLGKALMQVRDELRNERGSSSRA